MTDRTHDEQPETDLRADRADLRAGHAARAKSAAFRAASICHYVERHDAQENVVWKAAHAARVSLQALAVLSESAPDPAADSRCARNAAASAAQAAQMGQLHDGDGDGNGNGNGELALAACRAALRASQAASAAAGRDGLGADEALNTAADEAEADAVAAAERAGWMRPGQRLPEMSAGMRSPELMSMMHF
ncbi:hypothetical protein [Streptomyces sp. KL118A]|uniref:hypothetical protein n=1 Tax=Streptomyces sp. KL118A TaxID=3045153 RepID=UPI00278C3CBB|nr:hypothetical protein [Streptomyces sp. KL118A]